MCAQTLCCVPRYACAFQPKVISENWAPDIFTLPVIFVSMNLKVFRLSFLHLRGLFWIWLCMCIRLFLRSFPWLCPLAWNFVQNYFSADLFCKHMRKNKLKEKKYVFLISVVGHFKASKRTRFHTAPKLKTEWCSPMSILIIKEVEIFSLFYWSQEYSFFDQRKKICRPRNYICINRINFNA